MPTRLLNLDVIVVAITQMQTARCAQVRSRPEAPRNAAAERSDAALTAPRTARHFTATWRRSPWPNVGVLTPPEQAGSRARLAASLRGRRGLGSSAPTARLRER